MAQEYFSQRNQAEMDAWSESMAERATYDSFDVFMEDAEKSGMSEFAISALTAAHGNILEARQILDSQQSGLIAQ